MKIYSTFPHYRTMMLQNHKILTNCLENLEKENNKVHKL